MIRLIDGSQTINYRPANDSTQSLRVCAHKRTAIPPPPEQNFRTRKTLEQNPSFRQDPCVTSFHNSYDKTSGVAKGGGGRGPSPLSSRQNITIRLNCTKLANLISLK